MIKDPGRADVQLPPDGWPTPACDYTCAFWGADPQLWDNPLDTQIRNVQQQRAGVQGLIEELTALTDIREALATRIRELQEQRDTETTRPDATGMRRFKSFDMGSDFPHAFPLIPAAGHECYRSKAFRILWTPRTSHVGLTIW